MTARSSFTLDAEWKANGVTNRHLVEQEPRLKEIPSSNPEMTEAVFKANFEKLNPWLSERGWTEGELKHVQKYLKFTLARCEGKNPAAFLGYQLLKQSIEKKNAEVFEVTPKACLRYLADLAEMVDTLKEKGEEPVYKKMLEIIRGVVGPERVEFLMKSEPIDKTNRLARKALDDMKA